jgi:hypothetical protein
MLVKELKLVAVIIGVTKNSEEVIINGEVINGEVINGAAINPRLAIRSNQGIL